MSPPLALAPFLVDGTRYAVDLASVERVLPMVAVSPVPGAPAPVWGAIDLAGRVVPVVDLRRRLSLPPRDYALGAQLLVVRTPRRTLAIPADEATGVLEVDPAGVTATDAVLPGLGRVKGVAALPDGLLFLYDVEAFLSEGEERDLDRALAEARQ